jgi:transposase
MESKTNNGARPRRIFSEALKKKIVKDIEAGKSGVIGVCREYEVSTTAVYKWLNKYSRHLQKEHLTVVQMASEAYKTKELEKRIQELEAALGRKQMEVDYLNKMIEIGKEEFGVDLKKKPFTPPSTGSGTIKGNTLIN